MKTTVEISDDLAREAKSLASSERTSLRKLIEEGLRSVIAARARSHSFKLRDASVGGSGLCDGVAEGDWDAMRGLVYEGRGG